MAQKEVLIKINVDDKSLNQLTGDVKALGGEIQKIENIGAGLSIDQKFKAAQGSIKAFAGSVEAAVGAIGLLGIESKIFEEYERYALSVLSFGRGIFDLSEGLNDLRESGLLANTMLKAQNLLNKATAASARALGISTNAANVSFKALRATLATLGIGALIIALGYAVEKLIEFASSSDDAADKAKKLDDILQQSQKTVDKGIALRKRETEQLLALLKVQGASEAELEKVRQDSYLSQRELYEKNVEAARIAAEEIEITDLEEGKKRKENYEKLQTELAEFDAQERVRRLDYLSGLQEEEKALEKQAQEDKAAFLEQYGQLVFVTQEQQRALNIKNTEIEYGKLAILAKQYGFDVQEVEKAKNFAIKKLNDQYRAEDLAAELAYRQQRDGLALDSQDLAIRSYEAETAFISENTAVRISLIEQRQQLELMALTSGFAQENSALEIQRLNGALTEEQYQAQLLGIQQYYADQQVLVNQEAQNQIKQVNLDADSAVLQSKLTLYSQIGSAFGNLSSLFEEGTAAAKAAALAEIGINTAVGYVQGLDIAQKSAAGTGPAAAFAFPIFYATQIAAVLGAAAQAKRILSSSKSGGGSSTASVAGTTAPNAPSQTISPSLFDLQALPQGQLARVPGGVKQEPIRAYVLAGDVSSAQEADAKLNLKRTVN